MICMRAKLGPTHLRSFMTPDVIKTRDVFTSNFWFKKIYVLQVDMILQTCSLPCLTLNERSLFAIRWRNNWKDKIIVFFKVYMQCRCESINVVLWLRGMLKLSTRCNSALLKFLLHTVSISNIGRHQIVICVVYTGVGNNHRSSDFEFGKRCRLGQFHTCKTEVPWGWLPS